MRTDPTIWFALTIACFSLAVGIAVALTIGPLSMVIAVAVAFVDAYTIHRFCRE